jgi:hypothetical protein
MQPGLNGKELSMDFGFKSDVRNTDNIELKNTYMNKLDTPHTTAHPHRVALH